MSRKTTAWRRVARQHGVRMSSRPGELDEKVYDLIPASNNPVETGRPLLDDMANARRARKRRLMIHAMTTPRKGR